ncbi:MAG: hypothetical protein ACI9KE_005751, partial [Polyangiales bacterium]
QIQVTINGEVLVVAPRTLVYAGLLDLDQSTVQLVGGIDAGNVAIAGRVVDVRIVGHDAEGNRRVFANDGDTIFNASTDVQVVDMPESTLSNSFSSRSTIVYQGEGEYQLLFYPFVTTSSLLVTYNAGGVTHDLTVLGGAAAQTSRLRSDGFASAQSAICPGGCVAGAPNVFTLDSRDAFGAGHDPSADLACDVFAPGCASTGAGNSRGSGVGSASDYEVSMFDAVTGAVGTVAFVPGIDPDFFTYAVSATRAVSSYSLEVRMQGGDPIRGGCLGTTCLPNSDATTTLSAFLPLTIVPAATYPPGLENTYSPGAFGTTACIAGDSSTITLRPFDFFGNTRLDVNVSSYSAVLESGGNFTALSVIQDGDFIALQYTCPSTQDTPYTIDVTHLGNVEFPLHTFRLFGTAEFSESVFATLTPVQEVGESFLGGDSSGGPTAAWDMEDAHVAQPVEWILEEWVDGSYSILRNASSDFHVTLEDRATGELLFPSPITVPVAGSPGRYTVSFTTERVGEYTIRIFKTSILPAEINRAGQGFSVLITP